MFSGLAIELAALKHYALQEFLRPEVIELFLVLELAESPRGPLHKVVDHARNLLEDEHLVPEFEVEARVCRSLEAPTYRL